jgi:alkylation response protein AidB-like acyl-CoA dehydrogenase
MQGFGQIGISDAQIDILEAAERFCRERSSMENVRALMTSETGFDAAVWQEIAALGWLGVTIPEEYGGLGLTLTEAVAISEQMGRRMLHTPYAASVLAAQALIAAGTQAQKKKWLAAIAGGAAASLALFEKNGDWELANISASAKPDTDGYILSGQKVLVMDALAAKFLIMSVRIAGEPRLAIVKTDDIRKHAFRREVLIDETKRGYELDLEGVKIRDEDLLDGETTPAALSHIHLSANLLSAAEMTGACQSCIDYTVEYLGTRKQFGKLIGSFQALKHPIVDAFVEYQKSRSLLYAAAFSFGKQGEGEVATRMAAAQADKALSYAADRAIQFHGGFGFTYDCDAQLYRRRAIFLTSQYGDGHYHKQKLADLLL